LEIVERAKFIQIVNWKGNMKKLFTLLLFLSFSAKVFAQTEPKIVEYFDKNWEVTEFKENAIYYRTIDKQAGKFLVKDFYVSTNTLQMEALCSSINPNVQDGPATWYYANGEKQREGFYKEGSPVGLHKSYHENGVQQEEVIHREKKQLVAQHWTETGQPLLFHGSGLLIAPASESVLAYHTEFRDSVMQCAYSVSIDNQDTVYALAEETATYRGGMPAFYRGLSQGLIYPKYARRRGIEGKVFIQFIVDKEGTLTNPKVIKGIGGGCDEAALEACLKQRGWLPGRHKGKPVKTRMTLPVIFKLS
jgi:TonB family protein